MSNNEEVSHEMQSTEHISFNTDKNSPSSGGSRSIHSVEADPPISEDALFSERTDTEIDIERAINCAKWEELLYLLQHARIDDTAPSFRAEMLRQSIVRDAPPQLIQEILDLGVYPSHYDVCIAARHGRARALQLLLAAGGMLTHFALPMVVFEEQHDIIMILLATGTDMMHDAELADGDVAVDLLAAST